MSKVPDWVFICLFPFTGSQSVHSATLPEDTPYLLLEDLHYNQTRSNAPSLTQSNTHSVQHTRTDTLVPAETHVEIPSATDTEISTHLQLEIHSDWLTVSNAHSTEHTDTESDTHSGTHTHMLVQLQQVSAVQAANTERYV